MPSLGTSKLQKMDKRALKVINEPDLNFFSTLQPDNVVNNSKLTFENKNATLNVEELAKQIEWDISLSKSEELINEPSDIILNTYMRSGSTITGKLLGHRTDTFYLYEPLWYVARLRFYKGSSLLCHYYQPNCTSLSTSEKDTAKPLTESLEYLRSIFNCSFHDHSDFFIDLDFKEFKGEKHDWVFYKGSRWTNYKACKEDTSQHLKTCLQIAEPSCKSASHRVIKLLRMTLDNVGKLLEENKNLKVIQLFRDPRGIMNSHVNTGWISKNHKNPKSVRDDARAMCDRMLHDLQAGKELQKKFPGRIKFIQYEDIGSLESEKVKRLFKFAGMSYTQEHDDMINKFNNPIHHSEKKGFHPYNYRSQLSWEIIKTMDSECSDVLGPLGYRKYENEKQLRDLSQLASPDPLPYMV